ncbi:hypothetical protein FB451DRAFT_1548487 [Mycena latifolia]|nr:hypothetical protein FB451DRAFT_1548487 [Mycena latifolia]
MLHTSDAVLCAVPAVPLAIPLDEDIELLCALSQGINEASTTTLRNAGRHRPLATTATADRERYAPLLDSLAHLAVFEGRKQVVAVGMERGQANGSIVIYVAENGEVSKKTVSHLRYIFKQLIALRHMVKDSLSPPVTSDSSPSTAKIIQVMHNNKETQTEFQKFEIRLLLHSWPKIRKRLVKQMTSWNLIVNHLRAFRLSPSDESPLKALSKEDLHTLTRICNHITILEKLEPLDDKKKEGIRVTLNALHTLCIPLLEAWDSHPNNPLTIFGACLMIAGEFSVARWLAKVVSFVTHFLRVTRVIGSRRLSSLLDTRPTVEPIPTEPKEFSIHVSLDDIDIIAKAAGWEPNEQPTPDADPPTDDGSNPTESFKRFILASFHAELHKHLPQSATSPSAVAGVSASIPAFSAGSNTVERKYKNFVHCEVALLAHLHGRAALTYIGVSKLSCPMCHIYFAAYREATGVQMTTYGSHGQLGLWFLPTLVPEADTKAIESIMRRKLLEIISEHLRYLEHDPNVIRRFRTGYDLLSQSSAGSKDSQEAIFEDDQAVVDALQAELIEGSEVVLFP